MTFNEYVKAHSLDQDKYPRAEFGIKLVKTMSKVLTLMIIALALGFLFKGAASLINVKPPAVKSAESVNTSNYEAIGLSQLVDDITDSIGLSSDNANDSANTDRYLAVKDYAGYVKNTSKNLLTFLSKMCLVNIQIILSVVVAFMFAAHLINAILRQRSYERHVIINDWQAELLRRNIIRSLGLKSKLHDNKVRATKSAGSKSSQTTYDDRMKTKALTTLLQMKVYINTRQALDGGDSLSKQYRVRFDLPSESAANDNLMKELDGVANAVTKACRGVIKFGQPFLSDDRHHLVTRGIALEQDKYLSNLAASEEDMIKDTDYQSVYSTSLFIDHTEELAKAKEDSAVWTVNTGKQLNAFLATNKTQASLASTKVGSTNVLFSYDLAEDTQLPSSLDTMTKALDAMTTRTGSAVKTDANKLLITLPLPDAYKSSIDVPTLFAAAFGGQ